MSVDSLLASTSSDGRKLWGFELFRLALTRVPASDIPRMFTPNFMRSWVNHLAKGDRYLHKAAKLVVRYHCFYGFGVFHKLSFNARHLRYLPSSQPTLQLDFPCFYSFCKLMAILIASPAPKQWSCCLLLWMSMVSRSTSPISENWLENPIGRRQG